MNRLPPRPPPANGIDVKKQGTEPSLSVRQPIFETDDKRLEDWLATMLRNNVAPNTRRAYEGDLRRFVAWCDATGRKPLPATPETVVLYVTEMSSEVKDEAGVTVREPFRASSIARAIAAISTIHRTKGFPSPCSDFKVKEALKATKRTLAPRPARKEALLTADVAKLLRAEEGNGPFAVRNRALIAVAFNGALRRSEVTGLRRKNVVRTPDGGYAIRFFQSKTNKQGNEETIRLDSRPNSAVDPVRYLNVWLNALDAVGWIDPELPVFPAITKGGKLVARALNDETFRLIVKKAAEKAGMDPSRFGAHSLRSGFVTQMKIAGVSNSEIMQQTRHRSESTLREYDQRVQGLNRGATAKLDFETLDEITEETK